MELLVYDYGVYYSEKTSCIIVYNSNSFAVVMKNATLRCGLIREHVPAKFLGWSSARRKKKVGIREIPELFNTPVINGITTQ